MLKWEVDGERAAPGFEGIDRVRLERWVVGALRGTWWPLVATTSAVVAVIAALALRTHSSFQSDDVAQIVAVRSWARSGLSTYYSGANTYGLRFPLVWLLDRLLEPGKQELYVLTGVLVAASALALALAARLQSRAGYGALSGALAVAWVVSNPGVADGMGRPTVRNVELGAAALGLVLLDRLGERPPRFRWAVLGAAGVGLAFFLWNDPYFSLIVALPALVLTLIGAALARSAWRLAVAGMLGAGIAGARVLDAFGDALGIDALQVPFMYPKPEQRKAARELVFELLPRAIGTTAGRDGLGEEQAFANRLVVALLIVCGVLVLVWCARRWRDLPAGTLTAAWMIVVPAVAWYASSNMFTDDRSWRYVLMTPFVLPVLLAPAARVLPHAIRPAFLGFAALVIGWSLWLNVGAAKEQADCGFDGTCVPDITLDQERQDLAYAAWLENQGVQKVLVPYWHSNTTTYLSDGRVPAVTIDCWNHTLVTWRWLTTEARVEAPVRMSHLVLEGGHAAGCTQAEIRSQLGPPKTVTKFSDYQLWGYDGDIVQRLPTRKG